MPVYRQTKLIHIHIPKTSGTAIERFFHSIGDMVWGRESWLGQEFLDQRWYEFQHLSMTELLNFTGEEFRYFHSFAVIRNPYSRLVSDFLWRGTLNPQLNVIFDSFEEFVQAMPLKIDTRWPIYLRKASKRRTNYLIHVRPQHHYVCTQSGEQVVKNLLKFERLKPDFDRLLAQHGLKTDMITTPQERNFKAYFDRDMLDRVNMIYAQDFKLGSYEML